MKTILKLLVAIVAGVMMLGSACADGTLLINVDEGNPPFMFSKNGKSAGVYPAVMSAVFARISVPVRFEPKPWKRALKEIDDGTAGLGGIYKNDERAKKYDYSEAMFTENIAVYFNKAKPIDFNSVADLRGKKVGVIRGWSYGETFDAARKEGKVAVEEAASDTANLNKLALERLDAVLVIEEAGKNIISTEKLTTIEQGKVYLASNKAHLAFNKSAKQTELLANFNKALLSMKQDGSLNRIVLKEFSN